MNDTEPQAPPRMRRKSGQGFYEEGDRVIAIDYVGGRVQRAGIVGLCGIDSTGTKYLTIQYGEEPFIEAFICQRRDIVEDLPEDNIEAIEAWLEKES
jgi:hypothetical protein